MQITYLPLGSQGSWGFPPDLLIGSDVGPDSSKPTSVFSKECVNNNYQGASFFLEGLWGHFSACLQNIEKCRWLLSPWLQLPWRLVELASVLPEF